MCVFTATYILFYLSLVCIHLLSMSALVLYICICALHARIYVQCMHALACLAFLARKFWREMFVYIPERNSLKLQKHKIEITSTTNSVECASLAVCECGVQSVQNLTIMLQLLINKARIIQTLVR
jgi:hypothetical protein